MHLCCFNPDASITPPLGLSPCASTGEDAALPAVLHCSDQPVEVSAGQDGCCSAFVSLASTETDPKYSCVDQTSQEQIQAGVLLHATAEEHQPRQNEAEAACRLSQPQPCVLQHTQSSAHLQAQEACNLTREEPKTCMQAIPVEEAMQECCSSITSDAKQLYRDSCTVRAQPNPVADAPADAGAAAAAQAPDAADVTNLRRSSLTHAVSANPVNTATPGAVPGAAADFVPADLIPTEPPDNLCIVASSCGSDTLLNQIQAAETVQEETAAAGPHMAHLAASAPHAVDITSTGNLLPAAPASVGDWVEQQALLSAETSNAATLVAVWHNTHLHTEPMEGIIAAAEAEAEAAAQAAANGGGGGGAGNATAAVQISGLIPQRVCVWERVLMSSSLQQLLKLPAHAGEAAGKTAASVEVVTPQASAAQPQAPTAAPQLLQSQGAIAIPAPRPATESTAAAAVGYLEPGTAASIPADEPLMRLLTPVSSRSSRGSLVGRCRSTTSLGGLQPAQQSDGGAQLQHKAYFTDRLLVQLAEAAAGALQGVQQMSSCNSSESSSRLLQAGQVAIVDGSASQYSVHRRGYSAAGAIDVSKPACFSPIKRRHTGGSGDLVAAALAYQRQQQQQQGGDSSADRARQFRHSHSSSGRARLLRNSSSGMSMSSNSSSTSQTDVLTAATRARLLQQVSAALSAGIKLEDLMQQCEVAKRYSSRSPQKQALQQQQLRVSADLTISAFATGGCTSSSGGVSNSGCRALRQSSRGYQGSASSLISSSVVVVSHQESSAVSTQLNMQGEVLAAQDVLQAAAVAAVAAAAGPEVQRYQGLEQQWEALYQQWQQHQDGGSSVDRQASLEQRQKQDTALPYSAILGPVNSSRSRDGTRCPDKFDAAQVVVGDSKSCSSKDEEVVGQLEKLLSPGLSGVQHTAGCLAAAASEELPTGEGCCPVIYDHACGQQHLQQQLATSGISRSGRSGPGGCASRQGLQAYQNVTTIVWPHSAGGSAAEGGSSSGGSGVPQVQKLTSQQASTAATAAAAADNPGDASGCSWCPAAAGDAMDMLASIKGSPRVVSQSVSPSSATPPTTVASRTRSSTYSAAAVDRIQTAAAAGARGVNHRTAARFHYCPCCNPDAALEAAAKATDSTAYSCTESTRFSRKTRAVSEAASLVPLREAVGASYGARVCSSRDSSESGAARGRSVSYSGTRGGHEPSTNRNHGRMRQLMTDSAVAHGWHAVEAATGPEADDVQAIAHTVSSTDPAIGIPVAAAASYCAAAASHCAVRASPAGPQPAAAADIRQQACIADTSAGSNSCCSLAAAVPSDYPAVNSICQPSTTRGHQQQAAVAAAAGVANSSKASGSRGGSPCSKTVRSAALAASAGQAGDKLGIKAHATGAKQKLLAGSAVAPVDCSAGSKVRASSLSTTATASNQHITRLASPGKHHKQQHTSSSPEPGKPASAAAAPKTPAVVRSSACQTQPAAATSNAVSAVDNLTLTSQQEASEAPSVSVEHQLSKSAPVAWVGGTTRCKLSNRSSSSSAGTLSRPGSVQGRPVETTSKPKIIGRVHPVQPAAAGNRLTCPDSPDKQARSPERLQRKQPGIRNPGKQAALSTGSTRATASLQDSQRPASNLGTSNSSAGGMCNSVSRDCPVNSGTSHRSSTPLAAAVPRPAWNSKSAACSSSRVGAVGTVGHAVSHEMRAQQPSGSSGGRANAAEDAAAAMPKARPSSASRIQDRAASQSHGGIMAASADQASVPAASRTRSSTTSPNKSLGIIHARAHSTRPSSTPPLGRGTKAAAVSNASVLAAASAVDASLDASRSHSGNPKALWTAKMSCWVTSPSNSSPLHSVHWADSAETNSPAAEPEDAAALDAGSSHPLSPPAAVATATTAVSSFSKASKVSFSDGTLLKVLTIPSPSMQVIPEAAAASARGLHSCPTVPGDAAPKSPTWSGRVTSSELPSSRFGQGAAAAGAVADGLSGILAMVKQLQGNLAGLESDMHQLHGALHKRGSSMAASGSLKSELLLNYSTGDLGSAGHTGYKPSPLHSRAQSTADVLLHTTSSSPAMCEDAAATNRRSASSKQAKVAEPTVPGFSCTAPAAPNGDSTSSEESAADVDGQATGACSSATTQGAEEHLQVWNEQRRIEEACQLRRESSTEANRNAQPDVPHVVGAAKELAAGPSSAPRDGVVAETATVWFIEAEQQVQVLQSKLRHGEHVVQVDSSSNGINTIKSWRVSMECESTESDLESGTAAAALP